ncbi:cytochrome P450 2K1-like [Acanthochromis polyacanthus]|uniref:cytochrome P450 2K1-like n=1 Tax=Acanthochromis polyacanthus TaxID=80966 RepID=UPI002234C6C5|nr:cytochrome P450 2K1-like [Acanthochromis polyacanthus]
MHAIIAALLAGPIVVRFLFRLVSAAINPEELFKEPPGPTPHPWIGNLLQLDLERPYRSLYELSKKYGSVFTVYLGHKKMVVLAGYEAVRLAVDGYEQRNSPLLKDLNPGCYGIMLANAIEVFGMPQSISEEQILEECGHLIETFKEHEGNPFDTTDPVNYAVSNVIASIVYGNRVDYGDPWFRIVVSGVAQKTSFAGSATTQFYMFPRTICSMPHAMVKNGEKDARFMKDFVKHLKRTLNPNTSRGLVDDLLLRQQEQQDAGVPVSLYTDQNLVSLVDDLFATGTTTSATLRWALLFMAKYPQIQDQVQEELDRVLGNGCISMEDRQNLPFTNAVIHETQRMANIYPMAIAYQTTHNISFQGYFIKQGTTVFSLLTSVLYDESEWETPHTFNPAHFLNEEGKFIQRNAFVVFSKGRKITLGESLANMALFLLFTSLLQRFRITPPIGVSEDDLAVTPTEGAPPPHQLCAVCPALMVCSSCWDSSSNESRKEPPGPKPLLLVGNLLQLDLKRPYRSLYELSKKYGSVFTVYLGPKKVVFLAGYRAVKAAVAGYKHCPC